ncbi:MAG: hypothetical protein AAFX05_08985 [Planctomycetota bacterium]
MLLAALLVLSLLGYASWSAMPVYEAGATLLQADDLAAVSYRGFGRWRNSADQPWHDGWGVTYSGDMGIALAFGHGMWLLAGLGLALLGRGWLRMLGAAALLGWAALWFGNAVYLQFVRYADVVPQLVAHGIGLIAASLWLVRSLVPAKPRPAAAKISMA